MLHEKIVLQNKRSKRYICALHNGRVITTLQLGEAWLMFYDEWWCITRTYKINAGNYDKITVVIRGVE